MKRNMMNECFDCLHRRAISGNCHIMCAKPDPAMIGDDKGKRSGWFTYPINFDPAWKRRACNNFQAAPDE